MLKNDSNHNLKYLTRCYYYGTLKDWDYVGEALVIQLQTYTATEFFGGSNTIRIYVPTDIQQDVLNELIVGENYFLICAPYKLKFKKTYKHRVDLLLNIFKEIV
ncbi:MAG: hypothetical protein NC218_08480 [Acetobacter sp.]|nr:hypothetical protein [Acetobacter sp.]